MDQKVIFQSFVDKWFHPEYRPKPIETKSIDICGEKLKVVFPRSYYEYMTSFGVGGPTIELLDSIVEKDLEINDLSQVFTTEEVIESTDSWQQAGMPDDLISIASDSMGNMFCFHRDEISSQNDDAAIWFFDHDFDSTEKIHDSFTSWIEEMENIEKVNT